NRFRRGAGGSRPVAAAHGRLGRRVPRAERPDQSVRGRRGHARRPGRHGARRSGAVRGRCGRVRHHRLAREHRLPCPHGRCGARRPGAARRVFAGRASTANRRRRSMKLGSLLTAMITPFREDLSLNAEQAARLARYLVDIGNEGVVVAGTTGESATLTDEEKLELFRAVVREIGGRATVIAGTGTNDTRHSIELTKEAEKLGVDAIMAVVPY